MRKVCDYPYTYEKKRNPQNKKKFVFFLYDIKTNQFINAFDTYHDMIYYIEKVL